MIQVVGNLYVVLVLYRIKGEVTCDYLRFWSRAATSAEFHHFALRAVKDHLTGTDKSALGGRLPTLRRLYVWTDGHASTYKGFQNFGRMAQWPLKPRSLGEAKVSQEPSLLSHANLYFLSDVVFNRTDSNIVKRLKSFIVSLKLIMLRGFRVQLEKIRA